MVPLVYRLRYVDIYHFTWPIFLNWQLLSEHVDIIKRRNDKALGRADITLLSVPHFWVKIGTVISRFQVTFQVTFSGSRFQVTWLKCDTANFWKLLTIPITNSLPSFMENGQMLPIQIKICIFKKEHFYSSPTPCGCQSNKDYPGRGIETIKCNWTTAKLTIVTSSTQRRTLDFLTGTHGFSQFVRIFGQLNSFSK